MRRALLPLWLAACTGAGINVTQLESELLVTPGLVDVGEVAVGTEVRIDLQLDHIAGGPVAVRAVDVFNVEGDAFAFSGEAPVVPVGGTAVATLIYAPRTAGYDRAVVTVISDAVATPEVRVDVRGRAVAPDVDRWPAVLDFGPVNAGSARRLELSVFNDSLVDLTVEGAEVDGEGFEIDEAFPIALRAGAVIELAVRFTAPDGLPSEGDLSIDLGAAALVAPVVLRGNACATGAAALYDVDEDGWTTCAGDCDDEDPSVNPAAAESIDRRDQDCDGLVDEGTAAFDDDEDGASEQQGDCDDTNPLVGPHRAEVMGDGIDNDCDGVADTGSDDGDGDGVSAAGGDCNDRNDTVRPGAPELADGLDNDCDGRIDEGTPLGDDDGDGYCDSPGLPCTDGSLPGDCDDTPDDHDGDGTPDGWFQAPDRAERADGVDNDCDGRVDEGTARADDDGDGFTELGGDCDDANRAIHPGRAEIPGNGLDDDCDPSTRD